MKDPLPSENDKDEAPTPLLMQDTMQLDRRARAMLKAMGIQWSWPSAPAPALHLHLHLHLHLRQSRHRLHPRHHPPR